MAERREVEPVCWLDLVDDDLEAVAKVERHRPGGERLQDDRLAIGTGSAEPVLEQGGPQTCTLVARVDRKQAEVPVRLGGAPALGGCDGVEDGAEAL